MPRPGETEFEEGMREGMWKIYRLLDYAINPSPVMLRYGLREAEDPNWSDEQLEALRRLQEMVEGRARAFCMHCPGKDRHMFSCSIGGKNRAVLPVTQEQTEDGETQYRLTPLGMELAAQQLKKERDALQVEKNALLEQIKVADNEGYKRGLNEGHRKAKQQMLKSITPQDHGCLRHAHGAGGAR